MNGELKYTPEEFAQALKRRGYVQYIADARKYAKLMGKAEFTEADLETAYHKLSTNTIGREYHRDFYDDEYRYYKRASNDLYYLEEVREV